MQRFANKAYKRLGGVLMILCPHCGARKLLTRALRSSARHGDISTTCPRCGRYFDLSCEDVLEEREEYLVRIKNKKEKRNGL